MNTLRAMRAALTWALVGLVLLKLTHAIDWSWGLVLLPLWGPLALVVCGAALCNLLYIGGKDE